MRDEPVANARSLRRRARDLRALSEVVLSPHAKIAMLNIATACEEEADELATARTPTTYAKHVPDEAPGIAKLMRNFLI